MPDQIDLPPSQYRDETPKRPLKDHWSVWLATAAIFAFFAWLYLWNWDITVKTFTSQRFWIALGLVVAFSVAGALWRRFR